MTDAITTGSLKDMRAELADDTDFTGDFGELSLADCVRADCTRHAELRKQLKKCGGRHQTAAESEAKTEVYQPLMRKNAISGLICAFALIVAALAILLAGMVIGHLILLPDATVWPMGVASLICGVFSLWLCCVGLRAAE